ncbi:MFS transporter [Oceanobacillus manasiensis]|uniref:MFS transporter n=1 Tax=Oceanobacillus manasiensis TaxID=586413 RepID=UPI0005A750E9|nr:MFS transporter [Oceanobacillus manasiensis]
MDISRKWQAAMIAILFFCALAVVSSVYTMTPLTQALMASFQINSTQAAGAASIFSLFYAVGFLVFGPIGGRYGSKRTMMTGLIILGVITGLSGLAEDYQTLLLFRALQGFFAASFAPNALIYVFQVFEERQRITAISFISFGYVTAGVFGQIFATVVEQYYSWHAIFFAFGAMYFGIFLIMLLVFPKEQRVINPFRLRQYPQSIGRLFKKRILLYCYVVTSVLLLSFIGMYTILGGYLQNAPYFLTDQHLLVIRSAGFIGMVITFSSGYFVRKFGATVTLRGSLSMSVIGLIGVGLFSDPFLITIMSILFVAGISLTFPVIMLLIGKWGGEERATASSMYAFILFIGATLGPMLAVSFFEAFGFMVSCFMLAGILCIGSIFSLFIREKMEEARA